VAGNRRSEMDLSDQNRPIGIGQRKGQIDLSVKRDCKNLRGRKGQKNGLGLARTEGESGPSKTDTTNKRRVDDHV